MIKLPDDVMKSIKAVAKLNNDLYKWTSRMSYNGSWVGEPEGFIKGHIREMEKILDHLRAEVQRLNATAQPVSDGWVKCSDRMPKEDQMVIVWAETPVTEYSKYAYWNESEKQWWGDDEKQIYKVTHWMPLPAAPGGQDG